MASCGGCHWSHPSNSDPETPHCCCCCANVPLAPLCSRRPHRHHRQCCRRRCSATSTATSTGCDGSTTSAAGWEACVGATTGTENGTGTGTFGHDLHGAVTLETKWSAACGPGALTGGTLNGSAKHSVGFLDDVANAIAGIETVAWDLAELGTTTGFGFGCGCGDDPYLPMKTWNGKWKTVSATGDLLGPSRGTNQRAGPSSSLVTFAWSFHPVDRRSFATTTPCLQTTTTHPPQGQTLTVPPSKGPSWWCGPHRPRHRHQSS